jgi:ribosomal protein S18 acetylase RimI-like enzyme
VSRPVSADNFVRDARPADAAELARIQTGRWRAGYRGLVPDPVLAEITSSDNERRCAEHWAASLDNPPSSRHHVLVAVGVAAEQAGGQRQIAGFASFGPVTDPGRWPGADAELYELCVDPGQAGRGHGSRLLNAAAAAMAEDGFGTAFAWLLEQDAAARRFLESAGWATDGTRRSLDMGVPVPTIRLHTTLAAPG